MPDRASRRISGRCRLAPGRALRRAAGALILALMLALVLVGSIQPAWADGRAAFALEAAPPRMARLYIFRSGVADPASRETPALHVDGKKVFQLAVESYSTVTLAPGTYSLALKPGEFEARSWDSAITFTIQPNALYFLSVFKEYEPATAARPTPTVRPAPVAAALMASPGQSVRVAGVTFEFLEQIEAVKLLPGLSFVRPGEPLPYRGP